MAKPLWSPPPAQVKNPEVIGRRIFEDVIFTDELGQGERARLRATHFYDSRLKLDLSVDRLSQSGSPNKRILKYLRPQAEAENPGKFCGWGGMKVSSLRKFRGGTIDVIASPLPNNPYHADVSRDEFRLRVQAWTLAFTLQTIAEEDFGFVSAPIKPIKSNRENLFRKLCTQIGKLAKYWPK